MARLLCDGVFTHELVGDTGFDPGRCRHCGRPGPRQLGTRLLELTPELRAHYACNQPCDHPECQP